MTSVLGVKELLRVSSGWFAGIYVVNLVRRFRFKDFARLDIDLTKCGTNEVDTREL